MHKPRSLTAGGDKEITAEESRRDSLPLSQCTVKELKTLLKNRGLCVRGKSTERNSSVIISLFIIILPYLIIITAGSKDELLKRLKCVPSSPKYHNESYSLRKQENNAKDFEQIISRENIPEGKDTESDSSKSPIAVVKKRKLVGDQFSKCSFFLNQSYIGFLSDPEDFQNNDTLTTRHSTDPAYTSKN